MPALILHLVTMCVAAAPSLTPGDHVCLLETASGNRTYWVHVPARYDARRSTPLVMFLHGASMNGRMMSAFGITKKSDEAGFIAVCPDGTELANIVSFWNCGGVHLPDTMKPDDVAFLMKLLDEMEDKLNVDTKRIYVVGLSNGGMMAHRLAIEHSDRIAAIATVAGTLAVDKCEPQRPVPVLHFHGTADPLVPFDGLPEKAMKPLQFKSVDETIAAWVKADGCPSQPVVEEIPEKAHDGMKITKKTYGPGSDRAEVVLFTIEGGGHTWPGVDLKLPFLGKTTQNIAATDLIWDFFQKHPIK